MVKKSIFNKLLLTYLVIIIFTLAVLGLSLSQLLKSYFLNSKEAELINKSKQVADITSAYLLGQMDESTAQYILNTLDKFIDARVWVVDRTGLIRLTSYGSLDEEAASVQDTGAKRGATAKITVKKTAAYSTDGYEMNTGCPMDAVGEEKQLGKTGTGRHRMMRRGSRVYAQDINPVLKGSVASSVGRSPYFDAPMVSVAVPILSPRDGNILGAVFMHAPVKGVTATINKVYSHLVLGALLAALLVIPLGFYLSRTISRPLKEMNAAAIKMAGGDYSSRVKVQSDDEVGELAASFNYLAGQLEQTIDALHQEKSKLELTLTSMSDGVIAVDKRGTLTRINPAAESLLRLKEEDVEGLMICKVMEDIGDGSLLPVLEKTLVSGTGGTETFKLKDKTIRASVSPIQDAREKVIGAVVLLQDISEAEKLEQMRRDFIANVSHELRTPLTAIRGYNEALADGTAGDRKFRKKYHKIIRDEAVRLERLVNDLLDLSRLQSGKMEIEMEPLDLQGIIEGVVDKLRGEAKRRNVSLSANYPENLPPVLANEDRVTQLLIIFIDNAMNYTPSGGEIKVVAGEENEWVRVDVIDTGVGIPPEDLPLVWERFYKVDKARSRSSSGTGLGLAIAKQIAELHGGKVDVASEPGKGSKFSFLLKKA